MTLVPLNRRQVIKGLGYSLGVLALRGYEVQAAANAHFTHSVASGDPLSDRVILWTRVIAGDGLEVPVEVVWQVATNDNFKSIVARGETAALVEHDFTVKVDATGLMPNRTYYYRFIANGITSPVGRTQTLPVGDLSQFKIGIASCANYPQGYFNAYRDMAESDLDLVVHLGDYIYEYAEGVYANPTAIEKLGRHVVPNNEILNVEDYRMRYGLYRTDIDLQLLHQNHAFICVWDDHELANNTWKTGAENHTADEGDFFERMSQARQAYHEWMPTRIPPVAQGGNQAPIFRSFQIGNLADLIMLDTRLHGRDKQLDYRTDMNVQQALFDLSDPNAAKLLVENWRGEKLAAHQRLVALPYDLTGDSPCAITDYQQIKDLTQATLPKSWAYLPDHEAFINQKLGLAERTILGIDQESWLNDELINSKRRGAPWQIVGQQVLMGKISMPSFTDVQLSSKSPTQRQQTLLKRLQLLSGKGLPFNLDAWDGYPACRERVHLSMLENAANPVVLAGDTHNAWAFNMETGAQKPVGVEIGTPGITSPGLESFLPIESDTVAQVIRAMNSEIVDLDVQQRGWTKLVVTPDEITSQFRFVNTILSRDYTVSTSKQLTCKKGTRRFI